jgi:hypothetical protein
MVLIGPSGYNHLEPVAGGQCALWTNTSQPINDDEEIAE